MPVIALTQEMGSLAKDVALQAGAGGKLAVMRHEVLEDVADKMQVPTSLISRLREGKAGLVERLRSTAARWPCYTAKEVFALAGQGNIVLRGWGATCLLRPVRACVDGAHHALVRQAGGVADGPPGDRRRGFCRGGSSPQRRCPCLPHARPVRRDLGRPAAVRPGAEHRPRVASRAARRRSCSWPPGPSSRRPPRRARCWPIWRWRARARRAEGRTNRLATSTSTSRRKTARSCCSGIVLNDDAGIGRVATRWPARPSTTSCA